MTPRELACIELVELVTDYLEGALDPAEAAAVEAHLADCDYCVHYIEQMRLVIRTLGSLPAPELPDEMLDTLLAAFRRE